MLDMWWALDTYFMVHCFKLTWNTHSHSYTSPTVVSGQEKEEEEPQPPEPFEWTEDCTADTVPCTLQLSTPHVLVAC